MKIKTINNIKVLLALMMGFCSIITVAQTQSPSAVSSISIAPNVSGLNVGDIVHVPIIVTTSTSPAQPIATFAVYIDYNQNVLSPLGPYGFTQTFNGQCDYNPFKQVNMLYFTWASASGNNVTFNNVQVATLDFIYLGGSSTAMHLRHSPDLSPVCNFYSISGQVTISSFTDNTISGAATGTYTLHSLATGGPFDWNDNASYLEGKTPSKSANVIITGDEVQIFQFSPSYSIPPTCNSLTINPGGKLTLEPGYTLNVIGALNIQGDATGTGSFVDLGTTTVGGTSSLTQQMAGNWVAGNTSYQAHLVSSPVANQSNSIFTGSLMNQWNEVTQNWDPLTLPFVNMAVGKGYAVSPYNPGITVTFTGTMNTGDKTMSGLTKTGSTTWSGYNLIGNPYPSSITWDDAITTTNVEPTAWVWNGAGAYISFTKTIGGVIAPTQGFFVHATGTGSVAIPNTNRTHDGTFYKSSVNDLLTLRIQGNEYWDQTQIHLNTSATSGYESSFDALKLMDGLVTPQIFSMIPGDENLSINTLPDLAGSPVIELGFKPGTVTEFTLNATGLESFAPGTEFYLEDLVANKVQNLKNTPVYTFTAGSGQPVHRFNLHFAPVGTPENQLTAGIRIYSSDKTAYVNVEGDMNGTIVVYNLLGSEIARKAIQPHSINKINLDEPTGFYLVKVESEKVTSASKVFIR